MSSFYESIIKNGFYEKVASSQEDLEKVLDNFSTEEMEAIAAELDAVINTTNTNKKEQTLEEKLMNAINQTANETSQAKDEKKSENQTGKKDEKKDEKKINTNNQNTEPENKSAAELLEELLQKGSETELMIIKEAYDKAYQKLQEQGCGVFEYVLSKIASEEYAEYIAECAEKIAAEADINPLIVVDDIINTIAHLINDDVDTDAE